MAQHENYFTCDINPNHSYLTPDRVKNAISIATPDGLVCYHDVCDGCARKVEALIKDTFPHGLVKIKAWRQTEIKINETKKENA